MMRLEGKWFGAAFHSIPMHGPRPEDFQCPVRVCVCKGASVLLCLLSCCCWRRRPPAARRPRLRAAPPPGACPPESPWCRPVVAARRACQWRRERGHELVPPGAVLRQVFPLGEHRRKVEVVQVALKRPAVGHLVAVSPIAQPPRGGATKKKADPTTQHALIGFKHPHLPQPSALHNRTCPCPLTSDRTRNARAPTSPRSIGFCAIWDCISSSSRGREPLKLTEWSRLNHHCLLLEK